MFRFVSDLVSSIARLARSLNGLADTVSRVDTEVKARLFLEDRALPLGPEEVDHKQNGFLPPTAPPEEEKRPRRKEKVA